MIPAYRTILTDELQVITGRMLMDLYAWKRKEEYLVRKKGRTAKSGNESWKSFLPEVESTVGAYMYMLSFVRGHGPFTAKLLALLVIFD